MLRQTPTERQSAGLIRLPEESAASYNRIPFGFEHSLSELDLFQFDALCDLARKYDHDFFVAAGARTPDTKFYSVEYGVHTPYDALQQLNAGAHRVLLKRPEQYDARYGDLMRTLLDEVAHLHPGLASRERIVRLDSSILISSSATITPFHFDPEVSFFFQIEGDKIYHVYRPAVLLETELERFYQMGIVNIGQVELAGRSHDAEHVFELRAGRGMHQPQNSPHWVQTVASRSISYVFSFETERSRALGRTRAFNHYMRRIGLNPAAPHARPAVDAAKSSMMRALIPLRKSVSQLVRRGSE